MYDITRERSQMAHRQRRRKQGKKAVVAPRFSDLLPPHSGEVEEATPQEDMTLQGPGFDLLVHEGVSFVRTF